MTNDVADSSAIARAARPYLIVASNGMLTGGRIVSHLRRLIDDPGATILFVGYQGVGTLGASLQAVRSDRRRRQGRRRALPGALRSGFSAHADEAQILGLAGQLLQGRRPGRAAPVFLVHGDPDAQEALEPKVRALGLEPFVPRWRQRVTLD